MKSLTFTIDLKSVALGALLTGGLLTLANFRPSDKPDQPPVDMNHRYQAITGEKVTIILDTQTGKFLYDTYYIGTTRWKQGDFKAIEVDVRK